MTRIAFFAVYLAVILQVTFATPLASKRDVVIHERFPAAIPSGWNANERLHPGHVLNVQIALKQQNIDKLYDTLIDVSHPASVNYGKHWTVQKMAEHFEPSLETKRAVIDWLASEGIARRRIAFSGSHGFIHFNASASELEKLLHTRYYRWTHANLQLSQAGVHPDDNYSVPASVKPHIDYITPTVHIDPWGVASRISQKQARLVRRRVQAQVQAALLKRDTTPDNTTASNNITKPIIVHQPLAAPPSNSSLAKCGTNITPACLRAMYNIPQLPTSIAPTKQNALGVVEYPYDSFVQADLNTFFARYSTHQVQKAPIFVSVDGGTTPYQNFTGDENTLPSYWDTVESNLDLQYTMALVNPIPVTLFQAGDLYQGASFANFLQSLDASFCQYEDPNYDGTYPDPGYYTGPLNCGGVTNPPRVFSTSWGGAEQYTPASYLNRVCTEYGKLSMTGMTFAYSSGDSGVAGYNGCYNPTTKQFKPTKSDPGAIQFAPSTDAACPYVLAVGATKLPANTPVGGQEIAAIDTFSSGSTFYSGGGFSLYYPRPSYQDTAVLTYLNNSNYNTIYNATQVNLAGRGYPDISANGVDYVVAINAGGYPFYLIDGTSCSCPTISSILTIINEQRFRHGKSSVGFVNPALYAANASMFNDIVSGSNPGCGTQGFAAAAGWDPVTGLGTPNVAKLLPYFLSLP